MRERRRPGGRAAAGDNRHWLIALLIAAVVAGLGYGGWTYWRSRALRQTDPETACLTNAPTPQALLVMVDATDRLSPENAVRIRSRIQDAVNQLERYSRVVILPFSGDTATPLIPIFNSCVPGNAATADLDQGGLLLQRQYDAFVAALDREVARLQQLPDSRSSPISEQIVRAASDPQLHWQGQARTLVLVTDGLESSIYWTHNLHLPDPPEALLRGVRAEYFEIGNARGAGLQTREMRLEWKSWLERAGAEVRLTAPGFSAAGP